MDQKDHLIIDAIRNPLALIGLFVLLIEGIVAFTMTSSVITESQRWCFVYFCILFPSVVFLIFSLIVIVCPTHLYAPQEFKDERLLLTNMRVNQEVNEVVLMTPNDDKESNEERKSFIRACIIESQRIAITKLELLYDVHFKQEYRDKKRGVIFDAVGKKKGQTYRAEVKYCPSQSYEHRIVDNLESFFRSSDDGAINIVAIVSDFPLPESIQEKYVTSINEKHKAEIVFYSLKDNYRQRQ